MAWGGSAGWGYGVIVTETGAGTDPLDENARAERWAVERARERGGPVAELERVAVAAEARAWRNRHPVGEDSADSAAFRREQEQAADERGQLGSYQEVYGRAPAARAAR